MPITSTTIKSEPRGNGENYVVFHFTTDTDDVLTDGPRFIQNTADLDALAIEIGARALEAAAQQEIDQWLLP